MTTNIPIYILQEKTLLKFGTTQLRSLILIDMVGMQIRGYGLSSLRCVINQKVRSKKLWAKIGVEKINKEVITSYGKIKNLFESGRKL